MWTQTRGSHLYVACWSVCDREHDFWLAKTVLDLLISWSLDPSKLLIAWFCTGQRSFLILSFFAVWRWPWSLDRLSKSSLITWFNFDRGRKCFYTRDISDYPLFDMSEWAEKATTANQSVLNTLLRVVHCNLSCELKTRYQHVSLKTKM